MASDPTAGETVAEKVTALIDGSGMKPLVEITIRAEGERNALLGHLSLWLFHRERGTPAPLRSPRCQHPAALTSSSTSPAPGPAAKLGGGLVGGKGAAFQVNLLKMPDRGPHQRGRRDAEHLHHRPAVEYDGGIVAPDVPVTFGGGAGSGLLLRAVPQSQGSRRARDPRSGGRSPTGQRSGCRHHPEVRLHVRGLGSVRTKSRVSGPGGSGLA